MELNFPVQAKILKPISEVFDAVYNPKKLSTYFVTGGASGPMDEGAKVMWEFADFPGAFPVYVKNVKKNEQIVFEWEANDGTGHGAGYNTTVTFDFSEVDEYSTRVKILESGWRDPDKFLNAAVGNSKGWMQMVCCLKAYVEYGINLRKGFM
ncbi:SRPBCC domain-containing protein [Peredibacter starrii]|uniref:SRPBCC domain-containing protein n=1 Tax=Peredibacter starrii TaxID=28202 RepID=A0AAX4HLW7_9BACT|nr:SRPBCC domain-containing protein [Peredibacter starrii]WPU64327.1 SRPBCC domain-containing protein [Peredibacter starrii]